MVDMRARLRDWHLHLERLRRCLWRGVLAYSAGCAGLRGGIEHGRVSGCGHRNSIEGLG